MSILCMIRVWNDSEATGNDRLVLLAIADEADDDGRNAFPSIRRLAQKCRCHTDTVVESVRRLEAAGELDVVRPKKQGRGHFNKYKVLVGMCGNSAQIEPRNARVKPDKSADLDGYLRGSTRANPSTDPSTNPRKELRKKLQPDCGICADSGWIADDPDVPPVPCTHERQAS